MQDMNVSCHPFHVNVNCFWFSFLTRIEKEAINRSKGHRVVEAMLICSSKDMHLAQQRQLGLLLGEVCGSLLSLAILLNELSGNMTECLHSFIFEGGTNSCHSSQGYSLVFDLWSWSGRGGTLRDFSCPSFPYCTSSYSIGQGTNVGVLPTAKYIHSNYTFRVSDITADSWCTHCEPEQGQSSITTWPPCPLTQCQFRPWSQQFF